MLEEKDGSSLSNDNKKPKKKRKYLYLDTFNTYKKEQEELLDEKFDLLSTSNRMYTGWLILMSLLMIYLFIAMNS